MGHCAMKRPLHRRDPYRKIKREVSRLRRKASGRELPHIVERCDEIRRLLDQGYTLREGGPAEPRWWPPHPLWKREPPENP